MTTAEMIDAFTIAYDIANIQGPQYEPEEKLRFLNQAQIIEVMKEVSIRRWTYISTLEVNGIFNGTFDYGYIFYINMPSDYLAYISSMSNVRRRNYKAHDNFQWVNNIFIKEEDSVKYYTNDNNLIILLNPVIYESANITLHLIIDRNTNLLHDEEVYLNYIRRPQDIEINVDCEVNEILHERIVNTAVDIAKRVFNPQEAAISTQSDQLLDKPE